MPRVLLQIVSAWTAVFLLVANSRPAAAELPPEAAAQIDKVVAAEVARQKIPGLSAAVVVNHRLAWSKGYGMADLEHAVAVTENTVFRLASVSKPITATAIMQLVEKGLVDLDAPVQKYVPDFPEKPWPVTSRHLLAHLSGIRHYRGDELLSTRRYDRLADALAIFKDDPLLFQPGTRTLYTSYGYNLLGAVVEGAAKKSFADYVRDNICKPAGMERGRADDVRQLIPGRARGYVRTAGQELHNAPAQDTSNKPLPGGGLCSTSPDLARFAIAVQTGTLLKQATFEQMCRVEKTSDGKPAGTAADGKPFMGRGLGWAIPDDPNGRKVVRHGGTQPGARALLHMMPDEKFAVALLANFDDVDLDGIARQITDTVLGKQGK